MVFKYIIKKIACDHIVMYLNNYLSLCMNREDEVKKKKQMKA